MLTKVLEPVLAEIRTPTHCSRADAQRLAKPILEMAALLQKQTAEHRATLFLSEANEEHYPQLRGQTERLHQTAASIDRRTAVIVEAVRGLIKDCEQMCRYGDDIATWAQAQDKVAATAALAAGTSAPE